MALKVPKLPKLPYKFLIIGIILIIIYYVYSVSANANANASEKEPFIIGESIFDKALDRLNPLAASQNPLTNQAVVTGISEGDGITSRLMNQMALNIPTVSLSYESGPNGWTVLPAQCNKANTYVEPSPTQCSASGMRQKYLYQSDAGGACIQQAAGDPECDPTCPGANTQGGCNYHACDKTGQVPFSEVTDISQCDALGNRQAYAWASSASGSCIQDISGAPHCDPIRCPGANTLNGCAYCDTDASTKPTCPGYITPYTCTRADNPPADSCSNYKRRPVSWTNAKATATNAAECTAVTYGTAVCDASCNPPQQSTDASGCGYVPYTCTRADAPPVDSCSSYKRRPVSWTNPNKATITNATDCTAVTYGTAACSSSCNPPQQSTDPNGCNYVAPVPAYSSDTTCPSGYTNCKPASDGNHTNSFFPNRNCYAFISNNDIASKCSSDGGCRSFHVLSCTGNPECSGISSPFVACTEGAGLDFTKTLLSGAFRATKNGYSD